MADIRTLSSATDYRLLDKVLDIYAEVKDLIRETGTDDVASKLFEKRGTESITLDDIKKAIGFAETLAVGKTGSEALEAVVADGNKVYRESRTAFDAKESTKVPANILSRKSDYSDIYRVVEAFNIIRSNPEFGYVEGTTSDADLAKIMHDNYLRLPFSRPMSTAEISTIFKNARQVAGESTTTLSLHKLRTNPETLSNAYKAYKERNRESTASLEEKHKNAVDDYKSARKAVNRANNKRFWTVIGQIAMFLAVPAAATGLFFGAAAAAGGIAALAGAGAIGVVTLAAVTAFAAFKIFKGTFSKLWNGLKNIRAKATELVKGDEKVLGSKKHLDNCKDHLKQVENELSKERMRGLPAYTKEEELFDMWDHDVDPTLVRESFLGTSSSRVMGSGSPVASAARSEMGSGSTERTSTPAGERTLTPGSESTAGEKTVLEKRTEKYESVRGGFENTIAFVTEDELKKARDEIIGNYVDSIRTEFEAEHGCKISPETRARLIEEAERAYDDYVSVSIDDVKNPGSRKHRSAVAKIDTKPVDISYTYGAATAHDSITIAGEEIVEGVTKALETLSTKHRAELDARKSLHQPNDDKKKYFYHLAAREVLAKGVTVDESGKVTFNPSTKRNSFNETYVEDRDLRNKVLEAVDKYFFNEPENKEFIGDELEVEIGGEKVVVKMSDIAKIAGEMQSESGKAAGYKHYSERYNEFRVDLNMPGVEDGYLPEAKAKEFIRNKIIETYYPGKTFDKLTMAQQMAVQDSVAETYRVTQGDVPNNLEEHERVQDNSDAHFPADDGKRGYNPLNLYALAEDLEKQKVELNNALYTMDDMQKTFHGSYDLLSESEKATLHGTIVKIATEHGIDANRLFEYYNGHESTENYERIVVNNLAGNPVSDVDLRTVSNEIAFAINETRKGWQEHLQAQEEIRKIGPDLIYGLADQSFVTDKFVERVVDDMISDLSDKNGWDEEIIARVSADLKKFYTSKEMYLVDGKVPTIEELCKGVPGLDGANVNLILNVAINEKVQQYIQYAIKRRADQARFNEIKKTLGAAANPANDAEGFRAYVAGGPAVFAEELAFHGKAGTKARTEYIDTWQKGIEPDGYYGGRQLKKDSDVKNYVGEIMGNFAETGNGPAEHTPIEDMEFVAESIIFDENRSAENRDAFIERAKSLGLGYEYVATGLIFEKNPSNKNKAAFIEHVTALGREADANFIFDGIEKPKIKEFYDKIKNARTMEELDGVQDEISAFNNSRVSSECEGAIITRREDLIIDDFTQQVNNAESVEVLDEINIGCSARIRKEMLPKIIGRKNVILTNQILNAESSEVLKGIKVPEDEGVASVIKPLLEKAIEEKRAQEAELTAEFEEKLKGCENLEELATLVGDIKKRGNSVVKTNVSGVVQRQEQLISALMEYEDTIGRATTQEELDKIKTQFEDDVKADLENKKSLKLISSQFMKDAVAKVIAKRSTDIAMDHSNSTEYGIDG
ncbi:MAG: hypothetical protein IJ542_01925 [Clostridia bacterium]|nr:hypothetical protein [Clostridia bacterium]